MTRKDYIKLAAAIAKARRYIDNTAAEYGQFVTVQMICDALAEDNSAFDRDKFIEATYAKEEK